MKIIQLTPFAKARIWLNERATIGYTSDGVLEDAVSPHNQHVSVRANLVGIEAFIPAGARAYYGLLGVRFTPGNHATLRYQVPFSKANGPVWPDSLANQLDDARLGLPSEYAASIAETFSTQAAHYLPSGTLRIEDAVHGSVGSNASLFGKLAKAVLELTRICESDLDAGETARLFRSILIG